ncbi:MAG TPA: DUF4388 domain-containing protein [Candidatus Eremiobacteraeota bacterium]|nr:MAG: hypothetical protein BWY64_00105 [bacterium ADurb.Bin363]HPZ08051.1 DUF4388 domain-containing protein [Candidatus Eremiobacteraeota bacterium]
MAKEHIKKGGNRIFDLSEIRIETIICEIKKEKLTGLLCLEDNREKGEMYFTGGNIIYAKLGSITGERAIYSFVPWLAGNVTFIPLDEDNFLLPEGVEENVTYETDFLIDYCAKERSSISHMRKIIPSLDSLFEVINSGTPMYIKTAELTVLPWIDGKTSIREIGQEIIRDYPGIIKSIYKLLKNNIICKC